jgi:hypothetical protein
MPTLVESQRRDPTSSASRPYFEIFEGIVDYFRSYPAQYHRPKEDILLRSSRRAMLRALRVSSRSRSSTGRAA